MSCVSHYPLTVCLSQQLYIDATEVLKGQEKLDTKSFLPRLVVVFLFNFLCENSGTFYCRYYILFIVFLYSLPITSLLVCAVFYHNQQFICVIFLAISSSFFFIHCKLFLNWMDYLRLRAVSLFSWTVEQNTRDTQMTTRLTSRCSRACTPLTKNEEKERLLAFQDQLSWFFCYPPPVPSPLLSSCLIIIRLVGR